MGFIKTRRLYEVPQPPIRNFFQDLVTGPLGKTLMKSHKSGIFSGLMGSLVFGELPNHTIFSRRVKIRPGVKQFVGRGTGVKVVLFEVDVVVQGVTIGGRTARIVSHAHRVLQGNFFTKRKVVAEAVHFAKNLVVQKPDVSVFFYHGSVNHHVTQVDQSGFAAILYTFVFVVVDQVPVFVGQVEINVDGKALVVQTNGGFLSFLDAQGIGVEQNFDFELPAVGTVFFGKAESAIRARSHHAPGIPGAPGAQYIGPRMQTNLNARQAIAAAKGCLQFGHQVRYFNFSSNRPLFSRLGQWVQEE